MTDHCGPACPFAGCPSCRYGGGETGAGQRITAGQSGSRGKVGVPGNRTAPAGNRGLTPSDATGKG